MSTVTLPREIVETVVHDLKQAYINHPLVPELRAALDMSTQSTHPENMYEFRCKIDTSQADSFLNRMTALQKEMIVCETCGNKRCPHVDKTMVCTGSNEVGQVGVPDSNSVEFDRIKNNHLRSEALSNKTDWAAA